MITFDGITQAQSRERLLQEKVAVLKEKGLQPKIVAVVYVEDAGSVLYTRLKKEAAQQVGLEYIPTTFSLSQPTQEVVEHILTMGQDPTITGIIIQKPARRTWQAATRVDGELKAVRQAFRTWWQYQTSNIDKTKDVDGLHPEHLAQIQAQGERALKKGVVLPATAKAVLEIMDQAAGQLGSRLLGLKVVILGKSDILGQPLFHVLKHRGLNVEMLGSQELKNRQEQGKALLDADVVVSATGRPGLVTGEMVKKGVIAIDVGEPQPDLDHQSLAQKAAFITPVPGGVGPMTVVCLLENVLDLV